MDFSVATLSLLMTSRKKGVDDLIIVTASDGALEVLAVIIIKAVWELSPIERISKA